MYDSNWNTIQYNRDSAVFVEISELLNITTDHTGAQTHHNATHQKTPKQYAHNHSR